MTSNCVDCGVNREISGYCRCNDGSREAKLFAEVKTLREVAEAARNVVAQWRGDISRKPHIGRLREALAKLGDAG